jgi:hypothetical protein
MDTFKVICKADGKWEKCPSKQKFYFFGLIKITKNEFVPGPQKEEICIVTETYFNASVKCYILAGYPYGGYNSKYFVRLDEFTETQKEIAEKAIPILS